jgi:hypothetical protein
MSMIPKEIDSNFGQDGQRSNACAEESNDEVTQGGFCIDLILSVDGGLQCISCNCATTDEPSKLPTMG